MFDFVYILHLITELWRNADTGFPTAPTALTYPFTAKPRSQAAVSVVRTTGPGSGLFPKIILLQDHVIREFLSLSGYSIWL